MISAISWVPRGAPKVVPEVAEHPLQDDIEKMLRERVIQRNGVADCEEDGENMEVDEVAVALSAADTLVKKSRKARSTVPLEDLADGLKELDMDGYDEEDGEVELFGAGTSNLYYPSNEMDPYLKDEDDDDSEEREDREINPADSVIVCARTDEEYNHLEVYVFQEDVGDGDTNLYIHHEIVLSGFPLCTEWLDCHPLQRDEIAKGNLVAIGSMDPAIEIWDLDVIDAVEPCLILGGQEELKKKKKKGKKASVKYKEGSHTDSVLALAWNKEFRNILASGSGDRQVKIWDVATGKCLSTIEQHTDKVQAVTWNPERSNVLLSGSFDHTIVMRDVRTPSHSGCKWSVQADVESLAWEPRSEHSFVASLEDGTVKCFDTRAAVSNPSSESKPLFTLRAHDKAVCTISYNPVAPNLLATGSTDKMVKLWDLRDNQPSCVSSRSPKLGALFSVSFSEASPFLLAMGGSKGKLEIWDTLSDASVSQRFGKHRA